jgi:hypothetical protein
MLAHSLGLSINGAGLIPLAHSIAEPAHEKRLNGLAFNR